MTCQKIKNCDVNNCNECVENNTKVCKTCGRGKFKYENECVYTCPENYRADRITWSCLEIPVFAWYWVYPSRTTCRKQCGIIIQQDMDCSCSDSCFFDGNCCMDIEDECPEIIFWRKKGKKAKKVSTSKSSAKALVDPKKEEVKPKAKQNTSFLKKKD